MNKWISVNDRIPNNNRYVLGCFDFDNDGFEIGYFDGDKKLFYEQTECRPINNILFWHELIPPETGIIFK